LNTQEVLCIQRAIKKHIAFKIEGQMVSKIVMRTFLTSHTQGILVHKMNTSKYMDSPTRLKYTKINSWQMA
jgi:hypothetical protein